MPVICPTVTAFDLKEYASQLTAISSFSERIHIDLMDGRLAPTSSPSLEDIWIPPGHIVDIHLMYQNPMEVLAQLIRMQPHMVIIHVEADVHHMHFVAELHKHDILAGLAVLADTPIENAYQIMHSFDHVLVFSGNLGHHGGKADLKLLDRVAQIQVHHPEAEIGWDGGINNQNIAQLANAGVDVLNVGGFIQKSAYPHRTYKSLQGLLKSEN